jgi:hypothetical protein
VFSSEVVALIFLQTLHLQQFQLLPHGPLERVKQRLRGLLGRHVGEDSLLVAQRFAEFTEAELVRAFCFGDEAAHGFNLAFAFIAA